jgi:hypothetical protein
LREGTRWGVMPRKLQRMKQRERKPPA